MAKVNGSRWRLYRNALGLTSNKAADLLGIKGGSLRQIEAGTKPASDELVLRAARLYQCEMVELLASEDPVTEPPKRTHKTETKTGPGRDGGGSGTSPQRPSGAAA